MSGPHILVVGAGSVGSRHAANLVSLGAQVTLIDPDPRRAGQVDGVEFISGPFDGGIGMAADGVVVASPTSHHARHLRSALSHAAAVMVEKPMATRSDEIDVDIELDRVMVAYNLRLLPAVARLVSLVHGGRVGTPRTVRCWFGSWLPDWRPRVDYRQTYSAKQEFGGGVLLDAIHELDLLVWLSGDPDFSVAGAILDRVGDLEIDCEDTVKALLRHRSGLVAEVSLDYLSRNYRRGLEVVGSEATILLDWEPRTLRISDARGTASEPADLRLAGAYLAEARRFLRFLSGDEPPPVGGREGLQSLLLADQIRAAAR